MSLIPVLSSGGCSASFETPSAATASSLIGIHGTVHGGQQPIAGGHIYVYAAGTTGWGGASQSLLNASSADGWPTTQDGNGHYYVTTDAGGNFGLSGEYTCTSGQQVYIYASGGNPGAGPNSAIGLLAALGQCPSSGTFAGTVSFVVMNEVSTIAAAYALSGFAVDATDVSDDEAVSGNTTATQAQYGMANAFANASNLVTLGTGVALATIPGYENYNGIAPQKTINTLGNILATCVNSADTISGSTVTHSAGCTTLFGLATKDGTSTGTQPTDTATAAINIAHHPGSNVAALYQSASTTPPFGSALTAQPSDYSLSLAFRVVDNTLQLAIDAAGNVWLANEDNPAVTVLSNSGVVLSGSNGFTGGGLDGPFGIAIDLQGNAWITNGNNSITELAPNGDPISPSSGFTGGGLDGPNDVAVDGSDNIWTTNNGFMFTNGLSEFSSSGTPISPSGGWIGAGGMVNLRQIALDTSGNAWFSGVAGGLWEIYSSGATVPNTPFRGGGVCWSNGVAIDATGSIWVTCGDEVAKFSSAGVALSPASGYTGGGLNAGAIAIDGAGNAWAGGGTLAELSSGGDALSPSTGYKYTYTGGVFAMGIDGSGNVWFNTIATGTLTEFVGIAAPVVTPLSVGLEYSKLGTRP